MTAPPLAPCHPLAPGPSPALSAAPGRSRPPPFQLLRLWSPRPVGARPWAHSSHSEARWPGCCDIMGMSALSHELSPASHLLVHRLLPAASERPLWDPSLRIPSCLEASRDPQFQSLLQHLLRTTASGTTERWGASGVRPCHLAGLGGGAPRPWGQLCGQSVVQGWVGPCALSRHWPHALLSTSSPDQSSGPCEVCNMGTPLYRWRN